MAVGLGGWQLVGSCEVVGAGLSEVGREVAMPDVTVQLLTPPANERRRMLGGCRVRVYEFCVSHEAQFSWVQFSALT